MRHYGVAAIFAEQNWCSAGWLFQADRDNKAGHNPALLW
jgi:hypothetical protein